MRSFLIAAAALIAFSAPAFAYSDAEIANALMANAWCSFSYNQTTGYSHSRRAVFGGNGVLTVRSNNEGGSSGSGGSYYGQSQGGDSYGWRVEGGVLYLSDGSAEDAHVLDAKRSSSGGLVLIVDGDEWTPCR